MNNTVKYSLIVALALTIVASAYFFFFKPKNSASTPPVSGGPATVPVTPVSGTVSQGTPIISTPRPAGTDTPINVVPAAASVSVFTPPVKKVYTSPVSVTALAAATGKTEQEILYWLSWNANVNGWYEIKDWVPNFWMNTLEKFPDDFAKYAALTTEQYNATFKS